MKKKKKKKKKSQQYASCTLVGHKASFLCPCVLTKDWNLIKIIIIMALRRNGRLIFFDHRENGNGLDIFISCRQHEDASSI